MIGPLPPSFVRTVTSSIFVLRPAAAAIRSAIAERVGIREYYPALERWSTAAMISSTKPSRPMNAVNPGIFAAAATSWSAVCRRRSAVFMRLIRFHSHDLKDSLQLGIREEPDVDLTSALAVTQRHFSAQTLAQSIFDRGDMRIASGDGRRRAGGTICGPPRSLN